MWNVAKLTLLYSIRFHGLNWGTVYKSMSLLEMVHFEIETDLTETTLEARELSLFCIAATLSLFFSSCRRYSGYSLVHQNHKCWFIVPGGQQVGFYTRVSDNTGPPIKLRFSSKLETLPQKILTVLFFVIFCFCFCFFTKMLLLNLPAVYKRRMVWKWSNEQ